MTNNSTFYITTTTPYVNSDPHIGFALEIIQADSIARFHKALGEEIFFNTGTDEHGIKIFRKAEEAGIEPQAYVDQYAARFAELKSLLNLSYTNFIRTTDAHHKQSAQAFWQRCLEAGDIYKKTYKVKYCVGCELEKTDSELIDDKCPIHPNLVIELIEEENYFFKFSRFEKPLLDLYQKYHDLVIPEFRFREIISFVEGGLQDFSISRLKEKMPWGVPVPGDDTQVMYVWFDALVNYIAALGWENESRVASSESLVEQTDFEKFWGTLEEPRGVQCAGKDNLRQQSAMWQAMLMSAGLPPTRHILIHGFITSGGQKMSKSLGNVVDPFQMVQDFGVDALRFWLLHDMSTFEDGDFTIEGFKESYNANLVNGIGNLVSRVLTMAKNGMIESRVASSESRVLNEEFQAYMRGFEIQKAIKWLWSEYRKLDEYIAKNEPFKVIKVNPAEGKKQIEFLLQQLTELNLYLNIFLPATGEKIETALNNYKEEIPRLFPRLNQ